MSQVTHIDSTEILIHAARAEDMREVARVAGRDSGELPAGPLLVARVGGDLRAAISLSDGSVVADPFYRTTELIAMLKIRAHAGRDPIPSRRSFFLRPNRRFAPSSLTN